jgi:hypothetical protein
LKFNQLLVCLLWTQGTCAVDSVCTRMLIYKRKFSSGNSTIAWDFFPATLRTINNKGLSHSLVTSTSLLKENLLPNISFNAVIDLSCSVCWIYREETHSNWFFEQQGKCDRDLIVTNIWKRCFLLPRLYIVENPSFILLHS